jgi:hypothetical protein
MKYTLTTFCAISSLICLTIAPAAQARGVRADMGCPFAGGSGNAWGTPTGAPSPYDAGLSANYFSVTLQAGDVSQLSPPADEVGLSITAATQYSTYLLQPDASQCGQPGFFAPSPAAQVMVYTLGGANSTLGSGASVAGDTEIEFNYDWESGNSANNAAVTSAVGTASFTVGSIKYSSTGLNVPFSTDNDFLFNSNGVLLGSLSDDANGDPALTACTAGASISTCVLGWTSTTVTPTSAPEIDSSSTIAALTLLAGGLAVLRGRRPTRLRLR